MLQRDDDIPFCNAIFYDYILLAEFQAGGFPAHINHTTTFFDDPFIRCV